MALDNSLKNIFAVSELRNRVLFTLGLLGVFRIGGRIVTPGVDIRALEEFALQLGKNSMFGRTYG
jgi:preprotein translocase subunit SecY